MTQKFQGPLQASESVPFSGFEGRVSQFPYQGFGSDLNAASRTLARFFKAFSRSLGSSGTTRAVSLVGAGALAGAGISPLKIGV